ncbi:MAG: glycosyltransferase [Lachnospiraceae bacterium]|nr:glycosyltransferase [Lachnospiraceae bacterium]
MGSVKVSVITVSYKAANIIEKTIQSVISQDYPYIEYIIVDGGSTDGTVDIIKKYNDRINIWVSEPDKGIYDAMNKGVKMATGDWIMFLNAGDFYHSHDVLTRFIREIDEDTTVAYGLIHYFTHKKEFDMEYIPLEQMAYLDPIPHPATMTRLSYHKAHLFDTSFRSSGDYDFFYRAFYDECVKFQYIPIIITDYDNSEGISKDNSDLIWKENKRVWSRHATFHLKMKMYGERWIALVKRPIKRLFRKHV